MARSFAPHQKDVYKVGHKFQYPEGTTEIYANWTARNGRHSNIPGTTGVYFFGLQHFIIDYLINDWNETFFHQPKEKVVNKYKRRVEKMLNHYVDVSHIAALHDLGYLPVEIKALPEGSFVPYGVAMFTIKNTHPRFYWVTNMLESVTSSEMWLPITSATTYMAYKKLFLEFAEKTGSPKEFIPYQGHDFSMRGMGNRFAAATSGAAALAMGAVGTDTIAAVDLLEDYYDADCDFEVLGESVDATEHSVQCAGGKETEFDTYWRLLTEVYPEGIVSIVSDTWDFWQVITDYLPRLHHVIMNRNGKFVIRPDSGDPVEILCGLEIETIVDYSGNLNTAAEIAREIMVDEIREETPHGEMGPGEYSRIFRIGGKCYEIGIELDWNRHDKRFYFIDGTRVDYVRQVTLTAPQKGLIECLWDEFGGTHTELGYKDLNSHIGAIYGDSITYERAFRILHRLEQKGFASCNVVLGIGSYTYQFVTRDNHGHAMKSTNATVDGKLIAIFKDPKTDDGVKKSARGYIMVCQTDGVYHQIDGVDAHQERTGGCLKTVFLNGNLTKRWTAAEIREITKLW